ncbi:MAG: phosphatidate cytidylyltransferase [bacterium]|nr:phosphatidate cytidylyltransferase [bacterium]
MKTRMISAFAGLLLFIGILIGQSYFPIIFDITVMLLCAVALWELLNNTGLIKQRFLTIVAMCYSTVFMVSGLLNVSMVYAVAIFALVLIFYTVFFHAKTTVNEFTSAFCLPVLISYAFYSLIVLMRNNAENGLLYLFLVLCFAWASDTGAYFVGVFFGKHKLAPSLSPKKTIEGCFGGIIGSGVVSLIIGLIFNSFSNEYRINFVLLIIFAMIFSVVGMIGDLFASYIKRSCGIKDYGNIMPGHGGVLDRFDSILFIAPLFTLVISVIPIVKTI